jgi:hypothetical protein
LLAKLDDNGEKQPDGDAPHEQPEADRDGQRQYKRHKYKRNYR